MSRGEADRELGERLLQCADFFISGLGGGLRSARLGLFDEHGPQLFGGTAPGGGVEVLSPGDWAEDLTAAS